MKKYFLLIVVLLNLNFVLAAGDDGLDISLSSPLSKVEPGRVFRVNVVFSDPIKKTTLADFSVDGGSPENLRKINSKSYLLFVRAGTDVKEVDVQVEANKIKSSTGIWNEEASNDIILKVIAPVVVPPPAQPDTTSLSGLLDNLTKTIKQNNATQQQAAPQVQYYNCNGQSIPTTQTCYQQNTQTSVQGQYVAPLAPYNSYNTGYYNPYNSYDPYSNYNSTSYYNTNSGYYNPNSYYTVTPVYRSTPVSPAYSAGYGVGSGFGDSLFGW